jgi:hypothetical protein
VLPQDANSETAGAAADAARARRGARPREEPPCKRSPLAAFEDVEAGAQRRALEHLRGGETCPLSTGEGRDVSS